MRKCAFVPVGNSFYYAEGTPTMIKSFRLFHPDIDLVVFKQDVVDKLFSEKKINWYNATPYFAELLFDDYDLIVKIDADHVITGRLSEVFDNVDYDVAGPWNYNDYENASFDNITAEMYVQGGFVASHRKDFWMRWQEMNTRSDSYIRRENDILNLLLYNTEPWKLKILDRDKDYYGCKSLNREAEFYIENNKLMCRGEQVFAYHFAKGQIFPKLDFNNMPFTQEVKNWLYSLDGLGEGKSFKVSGL